MKTNYNKIERLVTVILSAQKQGLYFGNFLIREGIALSSEVSPKMTRLSIMHILEKMTQEQINKLVSILAQLGFMSGSHEFTLNEKCPHCGGVGYIINTKEEN